MEQVELSQKPDALKEKIIEAAYDFAETLRKDVDPMLDEHTRVKVCRTLTVAAAKLLESIGRKPVIKVRLNSSGGVYHYFLEDPGLGVAIDFSPISHVVGFNEEKFRLPPLLQGVLARPTLVLPLDSQEYVTINGVGVVEIRVKGATSTALSKKGTFTWDHIHLDKTPDTIKEKLEALR